MLGSEGEKVHYGSSPFTLASLAQDIAEFATIWTLF